MGALGRTQAFFAVFVDEDPELAREMLRVMAMERPSSVERVLDEFVLILSAIRIRPVLWGPRSRPS